MKKTTFSFGFVFAFNCAFAQIWEKKADIPVELAFPVVVELNGNIHVMGGGGPSGATNLHLRYKPATNKWDTLPPVPFLAQQPGGAVVNSKIHFCGGGYPNTGTRLNKHYYYDSDSSKWFQATNLPVATAIHKVVSFDNKLYIMSGQPDKTLCEYYDPASKSWVQKNPLPDQNFWYGAIVSNSKSIFRFGGGGVGGPTNVAHSYDKTSDSWVSLPALPVILHAPSATVLNDSLIFITGGYGLGITYDKTYIYHTLKKKYYPSDALPFGTNYHSMVTVNGCAYSVGGDNPSVTGAGISLIKICSPSYKWAISIEVPATKKSYEIIRTPEKLVFCFNKFQLLKSFELEILDFSGRRIVQISNPPSTEFIEYKASDFIAGNYLVVLKMDGKLNFEKWIVW